MAEPSSFEYTPCPLKFFEFKHLDHKKNCPSYESCLHKQAQPDELETLNADLSVLKDNVLTRIQLLTSEMGVLSEWQVKREYKRKYDEGASSHQTASSVRSKHQGSPLDNSSGPPPKRTKLSSLDDHGAGGVSSKGSQRGKSKIRVGPLEPAVDDSPSLTDNNFIKPKPDITDKFWSTVEPYCADITEEDIRMLQDYGSSNDPNLFELPPLGVHYSRQWGVQEIEEEATRQEDYRRVSTEAEALLMDGVTHTKTHSSSGPLTQRLMTAFLEDPVGSNITLPISRPTSTLPPVSPTTLEAKLREELVSLGLLDPVNEQHKDMAIDAEDEVLRELEKAQAELRKVIDYNRQQKQMLHSLARAEMRRQDIRRKLQDTDGDLMETLRRFTSYKQKKKREPISRKDREMAEKILETRQRLISQLLV